MLRILRIEYKNLPVYDGNFAIDLFAADRVMKDESLYCVLPEKGTLKVTF